MSDYDPKHGDETLNKNKEQDEYENDYSGSRWEKDEKRNLLVLHWVNGKIKQNSKTGDYFLSIKLGKPRLKDGKEITAPIVETEKPAKPAKPAKTDNFDDDIPF